MIWQIWRKMANFAVAGLFCVFTSAVWQSYKIVPAFLFLWDASGLGLGLQVGNSVGLAE
jgi:hypothetical protein